MEAKTAVVDGVGQLRCPGSQPGLQGMLVLVVNVGNSLVFMFVPFPLAERAGKLGVPTSVAGDRAIQPRHGGCGSRARV